jgi:hypothetical protein
VHDLTGADVARAGATYSADRIGEGKPIRKPYAFNGGLWVSTGGGGIVGSIVIRLYRIVELADFEGASHSYRECNWDVMRVSPMGAYHGMRVKSEGRDVVLCGPALDLLDTRTYEQFFGDAAASGELDEDDDGGVYDDLAAPDDEDDEDGTPDDSGVSL